ncbi:MAG: radical SAM protein [Dehalococcoidales bacterium]|nr:radical SAM protein [Dehalococcoidales bacterium]
MITIKHTERKSAVLVPSGLACLSHIPTINLTLGCAHNCLYCYARGYSVYPGDNSVTVYNNIIEKMEKELSRKKKRPQCVYFSPSSDIFQPVPEVLESSHEVLSYLLSREIGVAFLTKGVIPDKTMKVLEKYPEIVKTQIGIITPDDSIRRIFEPGAAPVNVRLRQIRELIDAGIRTEARIIPVIPGITNTEESMTHLFECLADTGIKKAAISTLFVRPAIMRNLRTHIADRQMINMLEGYYSTERMSVKSPHSSIIPLSLEHRREIYSSFEKTAGHYDIEISICGCMNPDIGGNCNISGTWSERPKDPLQPRLM